MPDNEAAEAEPQPAEQDQVERKPKKVNETLGRLIRYFKPYWAVMLLTAAPRVATGPS